MDIMPPEPDEEIDDRGLCAECGRAMQVRVDGLVRSHRDPSDQRCPGGGQPPLAHETPDSHRAELDEQTSHRLRLAAAIQGLTLADALTQAIDCWLAEDPDSAPSEVHV